MSFIKTKRAVVAGALAFGTIAGVGAAAIAGPAQDAPQQLAANAVQAQAQNVPEVRITSGDYPLEYRLTRVGGDGFGAHLDPNSTRDVQAEGYTTVTFFVDGEPVIGAGPLVDGKTLVCRAEGTADTPDVPCAFE